MNLKVDKCHRVLRIQLDRPHKRNALTFEMCHGIADAVDSVQNDPEVGSILITACGPVFCAGMDIAERVSGEASELSKIHDRLFSMGAKSLKPIVIGVNGAAFGGGLGLAVQGHFVISEAHSAFALPEIKLGLWPFLIYRAMEEAIGPRRLLALSLTGRNFSAEDALAWGVVHQICHDDEVCERSGVVARELAKSSPAAIQTGMQYVRDSRGKGWEEAGRIASRLREELMNSKDYHEGVLAFKERRSPHWPSLP